MMEHDVDVAPDEFYEDNDTWTPAPTDDNFKVVIRVRPPLPRELRGTGVRPYQCTTDVEPSAKNITISENLPAVLNNGGAATADGLLHATYRFTFDHVYDYHSTQEQVYGRSAKHIVLSILQGYNAAIIAYGQTGTGKTYTMEGDLEGQHRGIIPRTVEDIFTYIVNDPEPSSKYLVRASYLQIYNEVISDLLKPERTNLTIREDRRRGVYVDNLSEWVVRSPGEVYQLMGRGQSERATGATKLNDFSSRSHAVCIIIVEKCVTSGNEDAQQDINVSSSWSRPSTAGQTTAHSIKVGKLNLVDLAGSERVHVTGAVGKRLEESKKINASLSALGNVIAALTDRRERSHIPYRDSKLTRILEDSLGGNCKTTMICTIATGLDSFQESLSTLKFANRAKNIKNSAHVNEDLDQRTLLRKYERELRRLRAELQRRNRELVDKRHLLEIEEQKKRAEADKLAALTALEKRSREFLREKEERRALEAQILTMQSQLLVGGAKLEDVPAFRALLAREHRKIRGEYEARLRELETERQTVQEDRQQVDRYKQLLLKQRDIMIALTRRLNERDEQIMALQEELEAYDKYQRELEDALDQKTTELISLRKAAVEHAVASPGPKLTSLQSALGAWGAAGGNRVISHGGASDDVRGANDKPLPAGDLHGNGHNGRVSSHPISLLQGNMGAVEVSAHLADALGTSLHLNGGGDGSGANARGSSDQDAVSVPRHVVSELTGRLEDAEAQLAALQSENLRLAEQLAAAASGGHSNGSEDTGLLQEQVESLEVACRTAQNERTALLQILDSKVKHMLGEMLAEASAELEAGGGAAGGQASQQRVVARLRTLDHVVDKISEAIRYAPPFIES